MKFTRLCFAALAASSLLVSQASADIIASWDFTGVTDNSTIITSDNSANSFITELTFAPTFTGNAFRDFQNDRGSTDGTFGSTLTGGASIAGDGAIRLIQGIDNGSGIGVGQTGSATATDEAVLDFEIVNTTGQTIDFTEFAFDAVSTNETFDAFEVRFITNDGIDDVITSLGSGSFADGSSVDDYDDLGVSGLSVSLADGATGVFQIAFTGATQRNSSVHLDNVAIAGDLASISIGGGAGIPEPSSLALLGLGAIGLVLRRRRN